MNSVYSPSIDPKYASGHNWRNPGPEPLIPERFSTLLAYASEGGSEGYYVHVGAMLKSDSMGPERPYLDFGFCKLYLPELAYRIATECQRFLTATMWN